MQPNDDNGIIITPEYRAMDKIGKSQSGCSTSTFIILPYCDERTLEKKTGQKNKTQQALYIYVYCKVICMANYTTGRCHRI